MMLNQLTKALDHLGLAYFRLTNGQNGTIIVLQRGARILGVFPDESSNNLLWTLPGLMDEAYSKLNLLEDLGWNTGGDRVWLSPELEYNVGNPTALWETYHIQPTIDPGNYQLLNESAAFIHLEQQITGNAYYSNMPLKVKLSKTVRTIRDPLAHLVPFLRCDNYSFIGYELQSQICHDGIQPLPPLSLWYLMQIPAGGVVLIPTYGTANIHHFFGSADTTRVSVQKGQVAFTVDAQEKVKISIKVPYITGRIGYFRQTDADHGTLIVRHFPTKPSGNYGDVFVPQVDDSGHCLQCYNEDGNLGAFGEMEYHTAMMRSDGTAMEDYNETYCYKGPLNTISEIAAILLGVELQAHCPTT